MTDIIKRSEVELTPEVVKKYINPLASDQEIFMFIQLCKAQGLNPFLREAYLIKYSQNQEAAFVTGKDTFTKRAARLPVFNGFRAGVIVIDNAGQVTYREGSLVIEGETLVGGWAVVYRKDWENPIRAEVSLKEYERRKANGELMRPWKEMPATMIRKVALVQALREAFPEEFQGLYSPEEMPVDVTKLPTYEIGKEPEIAQEIAPPKKKDVTDIPVEVVQVATPPEGEKAERSLIEPEKRVEGLTELQNELMEALMELYGGDAERALDRIEKETTFISKRDGRQVKGHRDITRIKDTGCQIILRKIRKELEDTKAMMDLPLDEKE